MTGTLPGPWKVLTDPDGLSVPLYVIPFDRAGACTGPRTLDQLVAASSGCTDVFLFSHGWNDDWADATQRYEQFASAFGRERRQAWRPPTRDFKPLLAGVFWPSTALVLPWEQPPQIAGAPGPQLGELAALADDLRAPQARRLRELVRLDELDEAQTAELAATVAPLLAGDQDELTPGAAAPTGEELLEVWRRIPAEAQAGRSGGSGGFIGMSGLLERLDPRNLIRLTTVLLMKDRAGRVGAAGVAGMLRRIAEAAPGARLHLVGHSYGAKVMLSALCHGPAPAGKVDSVLLLQPAVSCLCFASDVDNSGRPGGYRTALERTRGPVVTTFSANDAPLTKFFHWAVRRPSDLGEAVIAGAPPSRYAALGGFGPQGAGPDTETVKIRALPQRYGFAAMGRRIVAVDGTGVIRDHGEVTIPQTVWALLNQVME